MTTQPAAPSRSTLLWNQDFRRLWAGEAVSQLGSETTTEVLGLRDDSGRRRM